MTSKVQLSAGSNSVVCGVGNFKISENIFLRNILYLSDFIYNLLLIAKLIKDLSCIVFFYSKLVIMKDLYSGAVFEIPREAEGLYVFYPEFKPP